MSKRKEILTMQEGLKGRDFQVSMRFREALSEAIKNSPYSREQIVAMVFGMTGVKISKHILDSMTAPSKKDYRFPAEILPAFCFITGDFEPLRILVETAGFEMIGEDEARVLKIARLEERKREIEEEIRRLKGGRDG